MQDLFVAVPNVEILLNLEPEELGAKLLFLLRKRNGNKSFSTYNCLNEFSNGSFASETDQNYPKSHRSEVIIAVSEAFAWLEAQGLIIPAPDQPQGSWRILSRRAQRFEVEEDLASFAIARRFPKELIHTRIAGKVWMSLMRGEFDTAIFQATREIEIAVREACEYRSDHGVELMRRAFGSKGPLNDPMAEDGERQALASLFAGAMGYLKNPQSHREVGTAEPTAAFEIVMVASHLLRIVDERRAMFLERKAVSGRMDGVGAAD